jgi:3-methyladenine DNA glycosylase Tag
MANDELMFTRIDALKERIQRYAIQPEFSNDVRRREKMPDFDLPDHDVLEIMIELIAFSQQAPANRVVEMKDRGVFKDVFGSFNPITVAKMDPEHILEIHWNNGLSPIRFRSKVAKMVDCARSLHGTAVRHATFMRFLRTCQFPELFCSTKDVESFWSSFDRTRAEMPAFFKNFTSLCHLLTTLGFPCAKPDKVVMKVAAQLGVVAKRSQYPEKDQRKVIRLMQSYGLRRAVRVPVVDLLFLIEGSQTDAKKFVRSSYYDG